MPKISVIVPIYNVEKYLNRCVDSVLAQTYIDFELILVDDGSPDNCGKICDEYAEKDSRIHVIHKKNGGLSDARNAGIDWAFENSESEWLTFIDSDDWIHPQYLEILYDVVTQTNCKISVVAYESMNCYQHQFHHMVPKYQTFAPEQFFCENETNAISAWGKLYAKDCFIEIRYPVGRIHEDVFVTYKTLFNVSEIAFTDTVLYYYFANDGSITRSDWNPKRLDALDGFEEQLDFLRRRYQRAFLYRKDTYLDYLNRLMNTIAESNVDNPEKYQLIVKKRIKKVLWKYRAFPIKKYWDSYIIAYPFLKKIYSIYKK